MSVSIDSGSMKKNIVLHMLAAHFGVSDRHLRELRAFAMDEVKRTNGQIRLDNAVRMQRRARWKDEG